VRYTHKLDVLQKLCIAHLGPYLYSHPINTPGLLPLTLRTNAVTTYVESCDDDPMRTPLHYKRNVHLFTEQ
jgi:hypothetical protein